MLRGGGSGANNEASPCLRTPHPSSPGRRATQRGCHLQPPPLGFRMNQSSSQLPCAGGGEGHGRFVFHLASSAALLLAYRKHKFPRQHRASQGAAGFSSSRTPSPQPSRAPSVRRADPMLAALSGLLFLDSWRKKRVLISFHLIIINISSQPLLRLSRCVSGK